MLSYQVVPNTWFQEYLRHLYTWRNTGRETKKTDRSHNDKGFRSAVLHYKTYQSADTAETSIFHWYVILKLKAKEAPNLQYNRLMSDQNCDSVKSKCNELNGNGNSNCDTLTEQQQTRSYQRKLDKEKISRWQIKFSTCGKGDSKQRQGMVQNIIH